MGSKLVVANAAQEVEGQVRGTDEMCSLRFYLTDKCAGGGGAPSLGGAPGEEAGEAAI